MLSESTISNASKINMPHNSKTIVNHGWWDTSCHYSAHDIWFNVIASESEENDICRAKNKKTNKTKPLTKRRQTNEIQQHNKKRLICQRERLCVGEKLRRQLNGCYQCRRGQLITLMRVTFGSATHLSSSVANQLQTWHYTHNSQLNCLLERPQQSRTKR